MEAGTCLGQEAGTASSARQYLKVANMPSAAYSGTYPHENPTCTELNTQFLCWATVFSKHLRRKVNTHWSSDDTQPL